MCTACLKKTLAGILTALSLSASATLAQNNYVDSVIDREGPFTPVVWRDLNGDGLQDLISYRWQRGIGRELLIYRQTPEGRFSPTPDFVEIKTEIIAVGFADLRDDPGDELVLFANNGVFSLSTAVEGYANNLKPLFEWKLIADIPDPQRVQFYYGIEDIDGDGDSDLLVPGQHGYGYFRNSGDEQFDLVGEFATVNTDLDPALRPLGDGELTANIDINSRDGIRLQVSASQPTPFADFIEDWELQAGESGNLLQAENWMPPALLTDVNGDARDDVVFINVGDDIRGQVNLLLQNSEGGFADTPDWQGPIDTRGEILMLEINGDGMMDLVRLDGDGNDWTAWFYRNQGARFDFDQPDHVMRFSGYDVTLQANDLDGDGLPELTVSYYTIPVVEAIRNTSIVRTQLIYSREDDRLFGSRPRSRLEESFSASEVRGLSEQMSLRHDVDGDGRPDALYITDQGAIAARRIDANLQIEDQPFWEYVPSRTVIGFDVVDLNTDNVPDLILRHSSSDTILVAN